MRLTVFNGSPKTGINNTEVLVKEFAEGFIENDKNQYSVHKLNSFEDYDEAVSIYKNSEYIIIAFPLHNYAMPALVKEFIEKLEPVSQEKTRKRIGFLVQFGYPEAIHARPLERYLEKLAGLLQCNYLGTIIKCGCGNITKKPKRYKNILDGIHAIGKEFGKTGCMNKEMLIRYSRPEKQNSHVGIFLRLVAVFVNNLSWDAELRKNGVYEKRNARPYAPPN